VRVREQFDRVCAGSEARPHTHLTDVQNDNPTGGGKVAFITVHDEASNHHSLVSFVASEHMRTVRERSMFMHVCLPGHDERESALPDRCVQHTPYEHMLLQLQISHTR
jgi:hypothetical protein